MSASDSSPANRLGPITRTILDEARPVHSLRSEVLELKEILLDAAGFVTNPEADLAAGETVTPNGVAISPQMAALCIDDFARTVQFLRGTHAAIRDSRSSTDRPVRVLYAGCGPLATLAIPLMSVLSPNDVRFTLIDIHHDSIESVRRLIEALGLADFVENVIVSEAAEYEIAASDQPDVLVIEMMNAALTKEPQLRITMHLASMAPQAIVIPDEITVDFVLVNSAREFSMEGDSPSRDRIVVGRVLEVHGGDVAPATLTTTLRLPEFESSRYRPMLCTNVRVYGEHRLLDYDSAITYPKAIQEKIEPGDEVIFEYEISGSPGFRISRS